MLRKLMGIVPDERAEEVMRQHPARPAALAA
jgi:hypothetical protein